jgi:hypothetical protein
MGQYLLSAKYEHNKLWGKDTGRNLAGKMSGTLMGIFPKLTLTFRKLTVAEMNIITPILDSDWQEVTYYDPALDRDVTMETYTGDWNYENKRIVEKNESFSCSFIATERRT